MDADWPVPGSFFNPRCLSRKYVTTDTPIQDVDLRPSCFPIRIIEQGKELIFRMDVLGEGTMEMVTESTPVGKLNYKGMRLMGVK
jgi:hypothetical protein